MRLPMNVIAFAGEKANIYKQFKDYFNHYHKKGAFDESVSLAEKEQKINFAVKEEIARLASLPTVEGIAPEVLASHPAYSWATFAVIGAMVDSILPEAIVDSVGLYTDVKVGGYGDSFSFDVKPRDLFVVSKAGKGKRISEVHKQFDGQVTIVPEFRDITVQVSLYKVLAGQENLAEFAMKAAKSLEAQMTVDAFNAFNTAMAALDKSGLPGTRRKQLRGRCASQPCSRPDLDNLQHTRACQTLRLPELVTGKWELPLVWQPEGSTS
jgi:hypothetical protein